MSKREEYAAKAADALAQLEVATNDRDRVRLRRAHGAWNQLLANVDQAEARTEARANAKPSKPKPFK